jgi:hypothetical protein
MKHPLTLACFLIALASYALWFQTGASILIAAGILLELTFWIRSARARRQASRLPRVSA